MQVRMLASGDVSMKRVAACRLQAFSNDFAAES